jgi:hypothetical protein
VEEGTGFKYQRPELLSGVRVTVEQAGVVEIAGEGRISTGKSGK